MIIISHYRERGTCLVLESNNMFKSEQNVDIIKILLLRLNASDGRRLTICHLWPLMSCILVLLLLLSMLAKKPHRLDLECFVSDFIWMISVSRESSPSRNCNKGKLSRWMQNRLHSLSSRVLTNTRVSKARLWCEYHYIARALLGWNQRRGSVCAVSVRPAEAILLCRFNRMKVIMAVLWARLVWSDQGTIWSTTAIMSCICFYQTWVTLYPRPASIVQTSCDWYCKISIRWTVWAVLGCRIPAVALILVPLRRARSLTRWYRVRVWREYYDSLNVTGWLFHF